MTIRLENKGMREVRKRFRRMARAIEDPRPVLRDFGHQVVATISENWQRVGRGQDSRPGMPPAVRSGYLRQGVTFEVLSGRAVEIGTNLVYGRIQHEGGTIKPKRARALAIPIAPEAERRGPREWPDGSLFMIESDDPETIGVLFRTKPGAKDSEGELEALYVLRGSVEIPARPWLLVRREDTDYFMERMQEELS